MPAPLNLQFKSYRSRIITYLVILFLLILGTVFFSVNRSTYNNTRDVIDDSLDVGREVFIRLINEREANFKVTFRALALDFAFRTAYNTGDFDTMLSVSENLLARTQNADMLMVVDYDYLMVADTLQLHAPETEFPWTYLLEDAEDDDNYETSSFILIGDIVYHIVAVPILTPLTDGWIIVGQRIDTDYVTSLKEIISSDVSIIELNERGNGRPVATTLSPIQADELAIEFNLFSTNTQATGMLDLADEEFVFLNTVLVERPELNLIALIQQSLPDALAPYRELEQRLILLFALGLCLSFGMAMFLGRSISRPVLSLVKRVNKIEQGDYSVSQSSKRNDEIGKLENSVDTMATGLAEKEKVRDLLGKVVSKDIADELMSGQVKLGGETRIVTILFSDIRDFTTLCEGRAPEKILSLLNNYLTEVSAAIDQHHGVVDKYIGDAVMALFGAPIKSDSDTYNALCAALQINEKVVSLNKINAEQNLPLLNTGIGLHTGQVVAGNLGSANRLNYTVIGDPVNLASRLESLTKTYGVNIIVSEETKNQGAGFIYRELDLVRVKGKAQPVRLYELIGFKENATAEIMDDVGRFEEMLSCYRKQEWHSALDIIETIQKGSAKVLYELFRERIKIYQKTPPEPDWDGVFTFQSK